MSAVQQIYLPHALPERFWDKVTLCGECWQWTGSTCNGYGRFLVDGCGRPAHRVSYQALVGAIPPGLELDHLCTNRGCVNPDHLEPVTHAENIRRAWARVTHCPNGHAYSAETRVTNYQGGFRCLPCRRTANQASTKRYRERRRAS